MLLMLKWKNQSIFLAEIESGRSAGRSAGRPEDVWAAPVSSEAKKKTRGVRPPAKPVKGGVWGGEAPPAKIRGVWGAAPPSQNRKIFENFSKNFEKSLQAVLMW